MQQSMYKTAYLLSGYPCSGKSTALNIFKLVEDVRCFEFSDHVRNEFKTVDDQDVSDNDLGIWAANTKENYGNNIFAKSLLEEIIDEVPKGKSVAVSGFRSPKEISVFTESDLFEQTELIFIEASEPVRWERYKESRDSTLEEFEERNEREKNWGLERVHCMSTPIQNSYIAKERFRNKIKDLYL